MQSITSPSVIDGQRKKSITIFTKGLDSPDKDMDVKKLINRYTHAKGTPTPNSYLIYDGPIDSQPSNL